MIPEDETERDPRETVFWVLNQLKEATTAEIIEYASRISHECKYRVIGNLATLLREELVQRTISKEKSVYLTYKSL